MDLLGGSSSVLVGIRISTLGFKTAFLPKKISLTIFRQKPPVESLCRCMSNHKTDAKRPQAKQGVVVGDALYPMPHAQMPACDILHQIAAPTGVSLKRDYQSSHDQVFGDDELVDLRQGNVFVLVPKCGPRSCQDPSGKPKLAFILNVEDLFEITINPSQTGKSLKRLLGIDESSVLYRDLESPNDQPIADDEAVNFSDGPVFIAKNLGLTIKVNDNPVKMGKRKATALEVKQAAIAQGVSIKLDFVLFKMDAEGNNGPALSDDKVLKLSDCDEFRCVSQDDNS